MTLAIFGVGVFIFFISVYGTVVAGGLRLTTLQVKESPELEDELGVIKKRKNQEPL